MQRGAFVGSPLLCRTLLSVGLLFYLVGCGGDEPPRTDLFWDKPKAYGDHCKLSNRVKEVKRPFFPNDATDKRRFSYRYEHLRKFDPKLPTIFLIPGGPGGSSMGKAEMIENYFPKSVNVILTDPRDIGCNTLPKDTTIPTGFYVSDYVASDVLAVVKALKLTDYLVYGSSWGTIPAAILSSIAVHEGITLPKAVIVEGILGRAFNNKDPNSVIAEWDRVRTDLKTADPDIYKELHEEIKPFGYWQSQWERFIDRYIDIGVIPGKGNYLVGLLKGASERATASQKRFFEKKMEAVGGFKTVNVGMSPGFLNRASVSIKRKKTKVVKRNGMGSRFYWEMACREVWEINASVQFSKGKLYLKRADICKQKGLYLNNPYDSHKWAIPAGVEVVTLQGTRDPRTPLWQARYFYDMPTAEKKHIIEIIGAGHGPLTYTMKAANCHLDFWNTVAAGQFEKLEQNLKNRCKNVRFGTPPA